ncbi:SHOCT domain-containing protein [Natrarchaeobius chitinivorans]|uniref:SHOCT domain-containing protein n=1 Tax=Natrarchaeobius chitinivorans TaxID=1679083 RepID=A0A3N6MEW9_NATCH|nr:SHOCT domain-containing protein [Natrarchaeobius chitinivorans]RQG95220.1 SHOCT domain-containing protein [Natrarchaeobius chitinivorans]
MAGNWSGAELSMPVAVVVVGVLLAFVGLAAIDTSVAIIVAIFAFVFGGEILRQFAAAVGEADDEPIEDGTTADEDVAGALERLRTRYADGELSDAEFERRLEILLETETVADVERYLADEGRAGATEHRSSDTRDGALERSSG